MAISVEQLRKIGLIVNDTGTVGGSLDAGDEVLLPKGEFVQYAAYDSRNSSCFVEAEKALQHVVTDGYGHYSCSGKPILIFGTNAIKGDIDGILDVAGQAIQRTRDIIAPVDRISALSDLSIAVAYLGSVMGSDAEKLLPAIENLLVVADDISSGGEGTNIIIGDIRLHACAYGWDKNVMQALVGVLKSAAKGIKNNVARNDALSILGSKCEDFGLK